MTFDIESSDSIDSQIRVADLRWLKDPFALTKALLQVLSQDIDDDASNETNSASVYQNRELIESASEILHISLHQLENRLRKLLPSQQCSSSECKKRPHRVSIASTMNCFQCRKHLHSFSRSRLCGSCKGLFCRKCLWKRHILPKSRANYEGMAYVCDVCINRMQFALDQYFGSVVESEKNKYFLQSENKDEINKRTNEGHEVSCSRIPKSYEGVKDCEEDIESQETMTKSWIQSRMTNVGDHLRRLACKSNSTGLEDTLSGNADSEPRPIGIDNLHEKIKIKGGSEDSDEEDDGGDEEEEEQLAGLDIKDNSRSQSISLASLDFGKKRQNLQRALRSVSYDCTTQLESEALSDKFTPLEDESKSGAELGDFTSTGLIRLSGRSYDDSCIVDQRKLELLITLRQRNAFPTSIMRFAVYQTNTRADMQSFKRALRFSSKTLPSNRCTLELDITRGLVSVRSVFIHRVWSFRCCDVRSIDDVDSRDGTVTAGVILRGEVSHLERKFEFQFDHVQDLADFKGAVITCQSRNFEDTRSPHKSADIESKMDTTDNTHSLASLKKYNVEKLATNFSTELLEAKHRWKKGNTSWLPGEIEYKDSTTDAALLIGPGGDSKSWGRIPGTLFVTNYRILFIPSVRCYVPLSRNSQGAKAYIPLFAVTSINVSISNFHRSKQFISYSNSNGGTNVVGGQSPAINGNQHAISIMCKDVRWMRVEVVAPADVVEEKTDALCLLITKLVDASQRYQNVVKDSFLIFRKHLLETSFKQNMGSYTSHGNDAADNCMLDNILDVKSAEKSICENVEISGSFAFTYFARRLPWEVNGWDIYRDEIEFRRQIGQHVEALPFLKLFQNHNGSICRSYPSLLLLPASLTNSNISKIASFRAKNRLPAVTYYHRRHRCVLVRSGQPLLGNLLTGSSSVPDQLLIGFYRRLPEIIMNQSTSSPSTRPIYIFDARKLKASAGNRLLGKGGVETAQDYPGAIICHLNIANIYRMQSSYLALTKLLLPGEVVDDDRTWLTSLDSTRWLKYVRLVLEGAIKIARALEIEGSSVLVHCSDGWDRTSQLVSLAQLLIDPYYRTIKGFAVLVQKDWCAFGHKFAERTGGDRSKDPNRNKTSPILLQFLDAVWQILRQFPYAFEFTGNLLVYVANSITSGLFGTFLYDTRLQRDSNCVREWTISVWTPVFRHIDQYKNVSYVEQEKPIWPWAGPQVIRLWEAYFLQWHPKFHQCRWISTLFQYDYNCCTDPTQRGCEYSSPRVVSVRPVSAPTETTSNQYREMKYRSSQITESRICASNRLPAGHRPQNQDAISGASPRNGMHSRVPGNTDKAPPMRNIFLFKS